MEVFEPNVPQTVLIKASDVEDWIDTLSPLGAVAALAGLKALVSGGGVGLLAKEAIKELTVGQMRDAAVDRLEGDLGNQLGRLAYDETTGEFIEGAENYDELRADAQDGGEFVVETLITGGSLLASFKKRKADKETESQGQASANNVTKLTMGIALTLNRI